MRSHLLVPAVVSVVFIGILLVPAEASAQCPMSWIKQNPPTVPPGRGYPAPVYDSARGVTVIFGGWSGTAALNDTWEWDGTNWTQRTPATVPPARSGQAMAYDSGRGVTVLFGGWGNSGALSDTWEWDGSNWSQRTPTTVPSGRRDPKMAYDSARGATVLFGGWTVNGTDLVYSGDTWEWDGTNWTQRTPPTAPSMRGAHAMAYDSARGVTVLFGGGFSASGRLNDTWEWSGTNWTQRMPATSPSVRCNHTMVYDSVRGLTVLFGGEAGNELDDTWVWDGINWMQRFAADVPSARSTHGMAYDGSRAVTVLFGGNQASWLNDTWEYQPMAIQSLNETFEDGDWTTNPTWIPVNGLPEPVVTEDPLRPGNKVMAAHGWDWGHGTVATAANLSYSAFEFECDFLSSGARFQAAFGVSTTTGSWGVSTEMENADGGTSWRLATSDVYCFNTYVPSTPVGDWWRIRVYHDPHDGLVHGVIRRAADGTIVASRTCQAGPMPTDKSIERFWFNPDTNGLQYVDNIIVRSLDTDNDGVGDACDLCPDTPPGGRVEANGCAPGDYNHDGDVDLGDFSQFQACFNGPNRPPAEDCLVPADLEGDGDVSLGDFAIFQMCFNGPNRPPACSS